MMRLCATPRRSIHFLRHHRYFSFEPSSSSIKIVEVGPRDGLQNESTPISTHDKIALIQQLGQTGLQHIEVGSFVSPQWVPQMEDTREVLEGLLGTGSARTQYYSCLVPNMKGMQQALQYQNKLHEVAIFASASETFSRKNINCSIAKSIQRFHPVVEMAKQEHDPALSPFRIRGYISCVLGCPYEGQIPVSQVVQVAHQLLDELDCDEVSLGDTIGVGTPLGTARLLRELLDSGIPSSKLAVHFHDTYGQALVNLYAALEQGITIVDASIAGLGGCPYAAGASGNVATEDVVYLLEGMGLETGVDLEKLVNVSEFVLKVLGKCNSKVATAMLAKRRTDEEEIRSK